MVCDAESPSARAGELMASVSASRGKATDISLFGMRHILLGLFISVSQFMIFETQHPPLFEGEMGLNVGELLVRPERFELPACCSGGNRSIQLSYGRNFSRLYIYTGTLDRPSSRRFSKVKRLAD